MKYVKQHFSRFQYSKQLTFEMYDSSFFVVADNKIGVHPQMKTPTSSKHQQYDFNFIALGMGGKWPYICCFVGCCFQDLFSITCSNLVQSPSNFFSVRFVSPHLVHAYSNTDPIIVWKKSHLLLLDTSDFRV